MPSNIIIKVKCDVYLIRFLETLYGQSPIKFPNASNFNAILDVFLDKPPLDHVPPYYDQETLEIQLPFFENKDVRSYNYLSPLKQRILIKEIWKYFKITFRGEVAKHIINGLEKQDAIDLFIEKYNLPVDCWDALDKDFQRYLKLRSKRRLFRHRKNSSVSDIDCRANSPRSIEELKAIK